MKRIVAYGTFACAVAFAATAFGRKASINTFAVNKVFSEGTNTIVCVPWSGYATNEPPDLAINKLVNSFNLSPGDRLLACAPDYRSYDVWVLQSDHTWKQSKVVLRKGESTEYPYGTTNGVWRGTGLFISRANPAENHPIYLHGQYATNASEVVISGGAGATNAQMLASMDYTRAFSINDPSWTWTGVGENDHLSVIPPKGVQLAKHDYLWDSGEGKWYTYTEDGTTNVNGQTAHLQKKTYDGPALMVPAGTGFWCVHDGAGDVTVSFPKPSFGVSSSAQD